MDEIELIKFLMERGYTFEDAVFISDRCKCGLTMRGAIIELKKTNTPMPREAIDEF